MNILHIEVPNPEELLNTSDFGAGALIRVEHATASAGPFAEVTTVALVAGTYLYTVYDSNAAGDWYRTRYSDSGNTKQSAYGNVFQAATSSRNYAQLSSVKQRLNIAQTDTTDDGILQRLCDFANGWLESRTGRIFATDPTTVYTQDGYDALESGKLMLFPRGIQSVTTLEVAFYTGAAYNTIPSTDYYLRPSGPDLPPGWPYTELWMTNVPSAGNPLPYFAPGFDTVRITGVFGWAQCPLELVDVCESAVVSLYRGRASGGTDSVMVGSDGARTIWHLLTTEQRHTVLRYSRQDVSIV